jgi:hypothetical protein
MKCMFIETILVPHPLAEDCYLGEALMWVAINRFPLDPLNEEAWDIRRELDEIVGLEPNVEVEGPTDLESARVGLSARPVHAGTLCALAPEQLKEMLADGDLEERTRQYLERELAASIAYRENCRRWDEEFRTKNSAASSTRIAHVSSWHFVRGNSLRRGLRCPKAPMKIH